MARLDRMIPEERAHLLGLPCPTFERTPWVVPPPLNRCRISLISTAGLHRRGDRPFGVGATDYRVIPCETPAADLIMSHISTNYDRTGFQMDWNVVFPLDRLRELKARGVVGDVASFHYSFMGATDPKEMEGAARELGRILRGDEVDAALLLPV
jgi:D-proline reductase (dithiol) PrdB